MITSRMISALRDSFGIPLQISVWRSVEDAVKVRFEAQEGLGKQACLSQIKGSY